jgi:hypothetical protein
MNWHSDTLNWAKGIKLTREYPERDVEDVKCYGRFTDENGDEYEEYSNGKIVYLTIKKRKEDGHGNSRVANENQHHRV